MSLQPVPFYRLGTRPRRGAVSGGAWPRSMCAGSVPIDRKPVEPPVAARSMSPRPPFSADRLRRLAYAVGAACAAGAAVRRAMGRTRQSLARARARARAAACRRRADRGPDRDAVLAAGLTAIPSSPAPAHAARSTWPAGTDRREGRRRDLSAAVPLRGREPQGVVLGRRARVASTPIPARRWRVRRRARHRLESTRLAAQLARRDADAWYRSLIDNAADASPCSSATGRSATGPVTPGHPRPPAGRARGTTSPDAIHPTTASGCRRSRPHPRRPGAPTARSSCAGATARQLPPVESRAAVLLGDPAVKGISSTPRRHRPRHARGAARPPRVPDPLTGLANRALFVDRLEHALYAAIRRRSGSRSC